MGGVIQFEERAVARLRERLGVIEEANQDLIAFARGHSGAVASIHRAVLAAMEADGFDEMLRIVTEDWPLLLGIDALALGLIVEDRGYRADADGIQTVELAFLSRCIAAIPPVEIRAVHNGHPMFGPSSALIGAEALIRLELGGQPIGLLALGQRSAGRVEAGHGAELLMFLGRSLSAMLRPWLANSRPN